MLNKYAEGEIVKNGINTYLELVLNDAKLVDFQIDMINSNEDKGLVKVEKSIFNTITKLKYNITKLKSLNEYIKTEVIDKEFIIKIFLEIANIIINSNELLLENSNFILKKEYIFIDEYSEKVKMINVPTVDKYCENIKDNFNIFALDFVTSIIFDGKIKDGSEKFVVRFKDTLKEKSLTINEVIAYLKPEGKVKENIVSVDKKDKANAVQTSAVKKEEPKQNPVKAEGKNQKTAVPKAPKVKEKIEEQEVEILEKLKYKTSAVVMAIVIQPIFIGIILCLFLLDNVSLAQIGIGAVLILVIDGILLKNFLDPKKKVKVRMKVPVKKAKESKKSNEVKKEKPKKSVKENKKSNNKNKKETEKSNNKKAEKEVAATVVEIPEAVEKAEIREVNIPEVSMRNMDETTILGEETTILSDDATTILGQCAYLEVNNGVNSGREEIYTNEYIVGRTANLKGWITNQGISREHFKIFNENGEYFIKDLGSKNGTKLNDVKLEANNMKPLKDGDVINIPNLVLTFKLS